MKDHLIFLTGKLAKISLEKVLSDISSKNKFTYEVIEIGVNVAALATINEMEKIKSYKILINRGRYLNKKWSELSKKYNLNLSINGIESITSFQFPKHNQLYKTFISQEKDLKVIGG